MRKQSRKDRWRRHGSGWLAGLGVALGLAGCRPGAAPPMAMPPPQVTVSTVEERAWTEWIELTGRAAAVELVEVRPRVSGHIDKVLFAAGQTVEQGQVLFGIDPRWYRAEFERREAEVALYQVRADNAQRDSARTAVLLAGRAISQEEADARETRLAEARAGLRAAVAARDLARLDLEFTEVRSPIAGRVSRAYVTAGNYVGGAGGLGAVLTSIVSVDPIHVYADMDEAALLRFNRLKASGQLSVDAEGRVPVELQLADETVFQGRGVVESIDNRVDPQSGSIALRTQFPNPEGRIVPGLFARIRLPGAAEKPTVFVDESAIGTDQAQKFVLLLTATNTTAYRPVRVGPLVEGKRVVREGLKAGDQVVLHLVAARVRPGMSVVPEEVRATKRAPTVARSGAGKGPP